MPFFLKNLFAPTVEEFNKDHCIKVSGISCRSLCRHVAKMPGVIFTLKPRFFGSWSGNYAEFVLRGHSFLVDADHWGNGWWIMPKDESSHPAEIQEIRLQLEKMQ